MEMTTILLVEDDPNVSLMLTRQLERAGHSVISAASVAQGRQRAAEGGWDMAILDRRLPDGDGLELCRELRAASPHAYLVMLTGETSDEAKLEGFAVGADDYVTKPFQIDELIARIRAGARIVKLQGALLQSNRQLEELSLTDALTGVGNRRAFEQRFRSAFEHARRYTRPMSLVVVDVDWFKSINDRFGHDIGDAVLKSVAHLIASSTRQTDFVGRIGGEEFAILLPETALFEAIQFAEKIRSSIAASDPVTAERVTVSIGVANVPHSPFPDVREMFRAADQALYRAKQNGRNRVELERRTQCRESDRPKKALANASA
jgi:two-component system cell cycle response regulator